MKKKGRISTYILGFFAAALVGGMIYGSFERDRMDPVYDKIEEQVQAAETEVQVLAPDEQESETLTESLTETVESESSETVMTEKSTQQMENATEEITEIEEEILPLAATLDIQVIFQEPELPTGCESVALTMAFNSLGFSLDKTTIADQYLVYDAENLARGYVGDPYSYYGAGVFPPGLTETANRFLKEQTANLQAYNITGTEFEELYSYIAEGFPVLIWTTMYYQEPQFSDIVNQYQGISYQWYANEHCVVLGGYDLTQNTVTLFDSLQGEVEIDIQTIQYLYDAIGQYAVVIH